MLSHTGKNKCYHFLVTIKREELKKFEKKLALIEKKNNGKVQVKGH